MGLEPEAGTEPIKQDIDAIRNSITDKMAQIETRVKDTVGSTVDSVKRTFDLNQQVTDRPWTAMGIALAAGFALGSMGGNSRSSQSPNYPSRRGEPMRYYPEQSSASYRSDIQQQGQEGAIGGLMSQFGDELDMIKSAAISSAMTMLREMLNQNLPQFTQEYERARQERLRTNEATMGDNSSSNSGNGGMEGNQVSRERSYETQARSAPAAPSLDPQI